MIAAYSNKVVHKQISHRRRKVGGVVHSHEFELPPQFIRRLIFRVGFKVDFVW
jgi:hypothetical protein